MDVSVHWEKSKKDVSSYSAIINLRPVISTSLQRDPTSASGYTDNENLRRFHVESFCTTNYHITATYDSKPLTSLRILVSTPGLLHTSRKTVPRPRKVLYKPVLTNCFAENVRECLLSSIDTFTWATSNSLTPRENIVGIIFRVELDDGSYLNQFDGSEFHVGSGKRPTPYSLEIPFSWPRERQIKIEGMLSLYRSNIFWLQPQLESRALTQLMHETNFVLVGLERDCANPEANDFVCMMVTRDPKFAMRSTLFSTGTYAAIRIESSCAELPSVYDLFEVVVCHLALGPDPYSAVRKAIHAHSLQIRTFSSRFHKLSSPKWRTLSAKARILTRLGYCTWDAVGHDCSEESVLSALNWLGAKRLPIGYVVIDDGWQDGGSSGPLSEDDKHDRPSPKLVSFHANHKFPNSLLPLSRGRKSMLCVWMTLIGYWEGADGSCLQKDTIRVKLQASVGLQRNHPNDTKMWEREYEIIAPSSRNLEGFFIDYFTALSAQGVKCVKIDGQSILGSFMTSNRHLSELVGKYRDALRYAAERVFRDEVVLNSMACAHEILLHSGEDLSVTNACWRTSDDHSFPGLEETDDMVAWHVLRNAMNSMFLGEIFPVTDWDMFRISDKNAYMHAVARVLSGGPVYISDTVPFDKEFESAALRLIQQLTTSDGRILRCHDPGRPTADCVFGDPRHGRMFKVFNRNAVSGVIGLFNLSTRETGHEVRDDYCSGDVEDFRRGPRAGFISVVIGAAWRCAFRHNSCFARQGITLWPMEAAIAHIYPILQFPGGLEVAAVGCLDLLNCGVAVKSVSAWKTKDDESTVVQVSLADSGTVIVWLGEEAISRLRSVRACDEQEDISFLTIDGLSFLSVLIPESSVGEVFLLRMTFAHTNANR